MGSGIPGARNVDHVAFTVPDLRRAVDFFVDVLGAETIYWEGPVQDLAGDWMTRKLNVHERATARIAMLRLGPTTNLELFEYTAPDQQRRIPENSDHGGHHLAIYVDDVDVAAEYLRNQPGVRLQGEPETIEEGPLAGNRWMYFTAPWGMQLEVVDMPAGMPYEQRTAARKYGPAPRWDNRAEQNRDAIPSSADANAADDPHPSRNTGANLTEKER
ncbi:VOC family protein [Saccharopolyspora sp. SCSIO 74807]|uniref:VOC family protein n=1 Tax=Saccharopolyspora sp. SCSIO 74807 TaxID=3118084 RepID=UPI0030CC7765